MKRFLCAAFLFSPVMIWAQQCKSHDLILQRDQEYPGYKATVDQVFEEAKAFAAQQTGEKTTGLLYRIPVVVHILYTNPQENLADSVIFSQIQVLNEDFRRLNADTVLTRPEFLDRVSDARIEFFLATTDPQGNPTNGINRVAGTPLLGAYLPLLDDMKRVSSGGADAWPTSKYLNIWVCNMLGGAVLGYAYPPVGNVPNWPSGSAPNDSTVQGVVLQYQVFGRNNPNAVGSTYGIVNKGRTAVHEIGHFLGLRHIWGDGDCTQDDGIADTPDADDNAGQVCNFAKNTCTENPGPELPDNIENFMDYAADSCMNMFTQGQVDVMRSVLENFRPGLIAQAITVGIEEATGGMLQLFPNPSHDVLSIANLNHLMLGSSITIVSLDGKTTTILPLVNDKADISSLLPGIYLVKIPVNGSLVMKKFIKL